jgi:crotonobetainyl-CoA:carnitine CoA-transferase CaiB-like acyl-CoA transferase
LADFGAEVIKVEPVEGDALRSLGKSFHGKSLYAASIFRNKSLISVDLRSPKGQEIIKKLVPKCDVVVENFRPGSLKKWGLGYDDLSIINPGLVMVQISGFGQSGPYSGRAGYGVIGEAVSGLRHITGDPDRPPARMSVSITDYFTGLYSAFGAVMALLARNRTGKGQCIDSALYECAFSFMEQHIPAYEKLNFVATRTGSRLPDSAPNNLYATRDHQFIHITALADAVFKRLAAAMGQPEILNDERFRTARARNEHEHEIDEVISRWVRSHDLLEVENFLNEATVPASRIFTMADIFRDPHYKAREMLVPVPDDELGSVTMAAVVPRLSDTPGRIRKSGGRVGTDTRSVLAEFAGLSGQEIDSLISEGVIYCDTQKAGA